jgi:hypothetical protein
MRWLSLPEAAEHGIEVSLLPPADATLPSPPSAVASQEPPPPPQGLMGRATGTVVALAARWSLPNDETMRALDEFYGDKVFYHGKVVSRQAVLLEKRQFAERWPQRSYKIRPHSMTVSCNSASETCRVQGIMDRELANPKANTTSRDVTNFDYSLTRTGEAFRIASETSSVTKIPGPSDAANPLASVQKGLEHLLAQVSRLRPPPAPAGAARPTPPVPTLRTH